MCDSLEKRVNLLDPTVLGVISSRVNQLVADLEALNKAQAKGKIKGSKSGNSFNDEQISDLAIKFSSLDGFVDQLPALLLRLKTLAQVHQEVS